MMTQQINVNRAKALRARGYAWPKIGRILAREDDRQMPYTSQGVAAAVHKAANAPTKGTRR